MAKAEGIRHKAAFHSKAGRELNRFDMMEWVCEPTIRSGVEERISRKSGDVYRSLILVLLDPGKVV